MSDAAPTPDDRSPAAAAAGDALAGFAAGATLALLGHLSALIAAAEIARDATTRRVTAELARLSADNLRFAVAVTLALMLSAGLVGTAVALALRFATPRLRRGRLALVTLGTAVTLALMVLRAFLHQPALLEPGLGGARGALAPTLARLAANLGPHAIDALLVVAMVALVATGAWRRRERLRPSRRTAAVALAFVATATLAFTLVRLRRPLAPKLLVLAADSLRPDRFGPRTTPALDALMARGARFDRALSPCARTTPAWVSILTGLYPHSHGVRHMFPRRESRPAWLDWLPRRLHDAGLRTSVVSDYAGDFFPIFDMGFDSSRLPPPLTLPLVFQRELVSRSPLALALLDHRLGRRLFPVLRFLMSNADPERLADEALDELRAGSQALFVFFSTTHVPFAAPWPWYRRFADPLYGGPHRFAYDVQRLADVTASDSAQPERDVTQLRALYDGALASIDAAMARVAAAASPDTLVVILSDHGENLFEPGTTTHHGKWFVGGDEANRVPLAFVGPRVPTGVRVDAPVSLVDVAPTLAELLGLPPRPSDGQSLVPALAGQPPERDVLCETGEWLGGSATPDGVSYPPLTELLEADPRDNWQLVLKARYEDAVVEAKHRALRRGPLKLIQIPTKDGVRHQLYDLAADPSQQHDLFTTRPEAPQLVRALRKLLVRDPERELDARDHLVRRTED
jgi:arylsulfatase A-like enzyme